MRTAEEELSLAKAEARRLAAAYPAYVPKILKTLRMLSPKLAELLKEWMES
jgi:hypothetical protein